MPNPEIVRGESTQIQFTYLMGGPLSNDGQTYAGWEIYLGYTGGTLVASSVSPNGWQVGAMSLPPPPMPMPFNPNAAVSPPLTAMNGTYSVVAAKYYYGSGYPGFPGSTGAGAVYQASFDIVCMSATITLMRVGVEDLGGGQWKHIYKAVGVPEGGTGPYTYSWTLPTGATLESGTLSSQSLAFSMVSSSSGGATGTLSLTITDSNTPSPCTASASIGLSDTQTGPVPDPCSNSGNGSEDDCECQQGNCMPDPCQVGTSGNNQVGVGNGAAGGGAGAGTGSPPVTGRPAL